MIKLALRKCEKCKQLIEDKPALVAMKDRNGNVKTNSKNEIKFKHYHQSCLKELEYERVGWNGLYDYILREFFTKELPSLLIMKLKEYRKLYSFQQMLDCLESIEEKIKKIQYKDFQHLSNLLVWMLKNNMEDYIKNQSQKVVEDQQVEEFRFLKINNSNIKESSESENYDILD